MEEPPVAPAESSASQAPKEATPMATDEPTVAGAAVPQVTRSPWPTDAGCRPMEQDPPQENVTNNNPATEASADPELKSDTRPSSAAAETSAPEVNGAGAVAESAAPAAASESVQQNNETGGGKTSTASDQQPQKPKLDLGSLPTRQYLDQTVVPILLRGLTWLAKTRPEDPVSELAKYLLDHKSECDWTFPQSSGASAFSGESSAVSGSSQGK